LAQLEDTATLTAVKPSVEVHKYVGLVNQQLNLIHQTQPTYSFAGKGGEKQEMKQKKEQEQKHNQDQKQKLTRRLKEEKSKKKSQEQ